MKFVHFKLLHFVQEWFQIKLNASRSIFFELGYSATTFKREKFDNVVQFLMKFSSKSKHPMV